MTESFLTAGLPICIYEYHVFNDVILIDIMKRIIIWI